MTTTNVSRKEELLQHALAACDLWMDYDRLLFGAAYECAKQGHIPIVVYKQEINTAYAEALAATRIVEELHRQWKLLQPRSKN